ncbi:unnamed protein product [Nyctereutes procyonoides]|uniref:Cilia- and flagella-associated protein 299 n=1 Tax=Nyctereutes procyonoides TaxID=34880 RepID=A0A811ZXR0_NYCPR|nr:unnamed protein product [Nyctereutes procyonoides]
MNQNVFYCDYCGRFGRGTAMDQDEGLTAVDNVVAQFDTYEDFLDSQITTVDLYYLEDESLARQLVELGYRGTGEVVKREDFEARKAAIDIAMLAERTQKNLERSKLKELEGSFVMKEYFDKYPSKRRQKVKKHYFGLLVYEVSQTEKDKCHIILLMWNVIIWKMQNRCSLLPQETK